MKSLLYYVLILLLIPTLLAQSTEGLVAHYKFDGNALDETINNNDGDVLGGVTWGIDRFGQSGKAAQFNGNDAYILVPNSASLQSPSDELTIAGWIYIEIFRGVEVAGMVAKTISNSHGQYGLAYAELPNGTIYYVQNGGAQGFEQEVWLDLHKWHFVALTKAANDTVKIFLNGEIIGNGIIQEQLIPDNNLLVMGLDTYLATEYFGGKLDDIRIYNRALTDEEVLELYDFIIPVELTSFTATLDQQIVNLNWITGTEINNSGFEIQRELNKSEFEKIGFAKGNGTTYETHHYQFIDDINSITAYSISYRLKQIDFDGSYKYSDIVEVEFVPTEFALYQNYPNPFNPTTKIRFTIPLQQNPLLGGDYRGGLITLKVYDVLGNEITKLVNEEKPAGSYEAEFDATGLSSGIYFYRMIAGNPTTSSPQGQAGQSFIETKKMILLR